jgi:hypothetical protein
MDQMPPSPMPITRTRNLMCSQQFARRKSRRAEARAMLAEIYIGSLKASTPPVSQRCESSDRRA